MSSLVPTQNVGEFLDNFKNKHFINIPLFVMLILGLALYLALIITTHNNLDNPWVVGLSILFGGFIWAYFFFSVVHDSVHNNVSKNKIINNLIGQVASKFFLFGTLSTYTMFSEIHKWHHKYTGNPQKDSDSFCGRGYHFFLPLRWFFMDIYQFYFCIKHFNRIHSLKQKMILLELALDAAIIALIAANGLLAEALIYAVMPTKIAYFYIVWMLVYLPHYSYECIDSKDRYETTAIRMGFERILTPFLMFQNYHLAHHLYPGVPFYQSVKIWKAREAYHLSKNPVLVSPSGRRINPKNKGSLK